MAKKKGSFTDYDDDDVVVMGWDWVKVLKVIKSLQVISRILSSLCK
jgi:hypothetical protein